MDHEQTVKDEIKLGLTIITLLVPIVTGVVFLSYYMSMYQVTS